MPEIKAYFIYSAGREEKPCRSTPEMLYDPVSFNQAKKRLAILFLKSRTAYVQPACCVLEIDTERIHITRATVFHDRPGECILQPTYEGRDLIPTLHCHMPAPAP